MTDSLSLQDPRGLKENSLLALAPLQWFAQHPAANESVTTMNITILYIF